jgi:hypothetical protein
MFARDAWRRLVGLGLRSAGCRFGLSALGLDLQEVGPTTDHLAKKLHRFLAAEPDACWALEHHPHFVERVACNEPDLVLAEFAADGARDRIVPYLHPESPSPLTAGQRATVEDAVTFAHGETRTLPDAVRPQALLREVLARVPRPSAPYARRLLRAAVLSFEPMPADPRARCHPPDFRFRRGLAFGVLDFVVRRGASPGAAPSPDFPGSYTGDLWVNIHHTGADGAPMQEMLSRLERQWGVSDRPVFPSDDRSRSPAIRPAQIPGTDRPISLLVDFIDFAPLLTRRARIETDLSEAPPIAGLLIWNLAREPEFAGRKFGTAVDVPPKADCARAVDLAGIRPSDYMGKPEGFPAFVRDYRRLMSDARSRSTRTHAAVRAIAMTPTAIATRLIALDLEHGRRTFGTVGLSILRNAQVFTAPMSDFSWNDGFIAIGNMGLSAAGGGTVAAVTIKGTEEQIRHYPEAIRRAVSRS